MNRINRVTSILIQLQSKKIIPAKEIAQRFNISLRTVYRDIRTLEEAGIPIGSEAGKGYFLVEGFLLPPVMFTAAEVGALITAGKFLNCHGDESFIKDFDSAMYKIKSILKHGEKNYAQELENSINVYSTSGQKNTLADNVIAAIQTAICNKRVVAHEMGHLIAGISAKYNFSDAGILLLGLFPIGAYVAHEEKKNATKAEKLKLALSGILVNLLIAGILFSGSVLSSTTDYTFIAAAQINCILAAVNLLPAEGLDGESALSALLGVESISETAKKWIMNTKHRRKLFHSGFTGYASFCLFGFIMLSKVLFWVLIVGDAIFAIFGLL